MQNLTQIGNQTFYHVLSSEIENLAIELDKTALIITHELLSKNISWIKKQLKTKVVEILVVGKMVNDFVPEIQERNVLLFAVNSFSEGIQLAVKSHRVVDNVICFCDDKSLIDFSNISEE
ncbi:MAG: hypothetical protein P1U44_10535 [Vicingaceae bacterium]|jgi:hypothetical protein|nr:hypothetical protein [Flavobacteriales bacterium]MBQ21248.1 hypothetical protein [Flavobacteriales bacterium]MDF1676142.1 hypothetical protein [Vicingaceae bacterium]|tara:strand:- start:167662 stop:168021 length:360 start_codon:yes stop_codon:yes gene_type:complete